MDPIPVGGFGDDEIRTGNLMGIIQNGYIGLAHVPGEDQLGLLPVFFDHQVHQGAAQDMAGHPEAEGDPRVQFHIFIIVVGNEMLQGQIGIIRRIQGFHGRFPSPEPFPGGDFRIGFLDVPAVRQQDLTQFFGNRRAVDEALEPFLDQPGQQAAVVDMSMAQDHRVNFARIEGKRLAVQVPDQFGALEHSAVQQDLFSVDFQQVTGPGNDFIRAQEGDFHEGSLLVQKFLPDSFRESTYSTARCGTIVPWIDQKGCTL